MKKVVMWGLPLTVCVVVLYVLAAYTHTGRVWSLYAFAAPKAPLGVKYTCIRHTNQQVYEKFLQPLAFDASTKNALKEYWYFSYYRACLFKAGYDFFGTAVAPSALETTATGPRYTNHFANISLAVPEGTQIAFDNVINPDLNDYLIASMLRIGDVDVTINMDRSYKLPDIATLRTEFAGFDAQKGFKSAHLVPEDTRTSNALAFSDDSLYGYVVLFPNHHIVTIFGQRDAQPLIDELILSLQIEK